MKAKTYLTVITIIIAVTVILQTISCQKAQTPVTPITLKSIAVRSSQMDVPVLPIGDVSHGNVNYFYFIGVTETTNNQYITFLSSVATVSDPKELWVPAMYEDSHSGIGRICEFEGPCSYYPKESFGDKPVNHVSYSNCLRYCNWLHNGQPVGLQDETTTENGSYDLRGLTEQEIFFYAVRTAAATYVLPTRSEWLKAAYYDGYLDSWWGYATKSNSSPDSSPSDINGNLVSPGQSVVNYLDAADWNGMNGNVSTVGSADSYSYYGCLDLNGNVSEILDEVKFVGSQNICTHVHMGGTYSTDTAINLKTEYGLLSSLLQPETLHGETARLPARGFRIVKKLTEY